MLRGKWPAIEIMPSFGTLLASVDGWCLVQPDCAGPRCQDEQGKQARPGMAKDENENTGGEDFDLSAEELAKLSPEEQEIIRQQAEIMNAAAAEKSEGESAGEQPAEEPAIDAEMLALAAELGVPAEEMASLSPEERAIILEQAKIMADAIDGSHPPADWKDAAARWED